MGKRTGRAVMTRFTDSPPRSVATRTLINRQLRHYAPRQRDPFWCSRHLNGVEGLRVR